MCAALREVHVKWAASYSRPLWPLLHEMRRQVCMCVCVLFSHTRNGFRGHCIVLLGVMHTVILWCGVGSTPGGVLPSGTISAVTDIEGTMISWCSSHICTYCMCACLMLHKATHTQCKHPRLRPGESA